MRPIRQPDFPRGPPAAVGIGIHAYRLTWSAIPHKKSSSRIERQARWRGPVRQPDGRQLTAIIGIAHGSPPGIFPFGLEQVAHGRRGIRRVQRPEEPIGRNGYMARTEYGEPRALAHGLLVKHTDARRRRVAHEKASLAVACEAANLRAHRRRSHMQHHLIAEASTPAGKWRMTAGERPSRYAEPGKPLRRIGIALQVARFIALHHRDEHVPAADRCDASSTHAGTVQVGAGSDRLPVSVDTEPPSRTVRRTRPDDRATGRNGHSRIRILVPCRFTDCVAQARARQDDRTSRYKQPNDQGPGQTNAPPSHCADRRRRLGRDFGEFGPIPCFHGLAATGDSLWYTALSHRPNGGLTTRLRVTRQCVAMVGSPEPP